MICPACKLPYITIPEALVQEAKGHHYHGGEAWCWGRGDCRKQIVAAEAHKEQIPGEEREARLDALTAAAETVGALLAKPVAELVDDIQFLIGEIERREDEAYDAGQERQASDY